ncbi:hypothetical protein ILUMI_02495 [Ignelater luminosus]|uniref:Regulatory protein zeste n=1 Tax=Ignelater luminosus TaxID=2038154 RepID=A0A8K0DNP4_IGNLU|nr:hypothetical protein ILUMI_02495 [Ignelater luminosus]
MLKHKSESSCIRGSNFTKEQELSLLNIIAKYKNLVECKNSNKITTKQREEAWINIETEFNSCNRHQILHQIKSKFDNLKTAARKYACCNKENLNITGGGPSDNLENVYDKMLEIINNKTLIGLENPYYDDDGRSSGVLLVEPIEIVEEQSMVYEPVESTSIQEQLNRIEMDNELLSYPITITQETNECTSSDLTENWATYTPTMLKARKNRKLQVINKPTQKIKEKRTLHDLKVSYLQQKPNNLINDDRRREELHEKQLALLSLEIKQKSGE